MIDLAPRALGPIQIFQNKLQLFPSINLSDMNLTVHLLNNIYKDIPFFKKINCFITDNVWTTIDIKIMTTFFFISHFS